MKRPTWDEFGTRQWWASNIPDENNDYYDLVKAYVDGYEIIHHGDTSDDYHFDAPAEYYKIGIKIHDSCFKSRRVRRFI